MANVIRNYPTQALNFALKDTYKNTYWVELTKTSSSGSALPEIWLRQGRLEPRRCALCIRWTLRGRDWLRMWERVSEKWNYEKSEKL